MRLIEGVEDEPGFRAVRAARTSSETLRNFVRGEDATEIRLVPRGNRGASRGRRGKCRTIVIAGQWLTGVEVEGGIEQNDSTT